MRNLVCLILLGTVVAAQNLWSQSPEDFTWRVFSPPDQSFSIELPSKPEITHDHVLSREPWIGESYRSIDATQNIHFFSVDVVCANGSHAKDVSLEVYLRTLAEYSRASGHKVSLKKITIDRLEGWERVAAKHGDFTVERWLTAGPRIYVLSMVSNSATDRFAPSVQRFFNSFHLNRQPASPFPDCPKIEGRLPVATKGTIHFVEFPDHWMKLERGQEEYLSAEWLEVRSASASGERELLFGATAYENYSRNSYGVKLASTVQIHEVSKAEWQRAPRISNRGEKVFPPWDAAKTPEVFSHNGREYPKSSEHWGSAIVSPNGRWVAVYSYSGLKFPPNMFSGGLPREGDAYWEVFDTRSGEKILAWTARFVYNPAMLDHGAIWIGDEYLLMPFDNALESCVIGVLPRN